MLISKKHNFLFIHIYKNAGTSITKALKPFSQGPLQTMVNRAFKSVDLRPPFFDAQPFHKHIKGPELVDAIGKKTFKSFFSFAIVRNPWDWQVSIYKYMLKDKKHFQHEFAKGLKSFDEYIRWRCENEIRYQKDFIYSNNGELLVDFVGRYENIDLDFKNICSRIGIEATLPKLNVSNTKPYQQFYTDETRELVRRSFKHDIELFEFDF